MPHGVVLEEELARERRVEVKRDRRHAVELLVPQVADGLGELGVPAEEGDRLHTGCRDVLAGMPGVDLVHGVPGDAGDRLPLGDGLGELDLERILWWRHDGR